MKHISQTESNISNKSPSRSVYDNYLKTTEYKV
jgi:hypothetical protein